MLPFPLQPLSICDHHGKQREKAKKTQKLLYRLREVGPKPNPILDLVQVESNDFLSMTVAQWITGIQLLHETAVPGTPVVSGHDVVKGQMAQPLGARRRIKWPP